MPSCSCTMHYWPTIQAVDAWSGHGMAHGMRHQAHTSTMHHAPCTTLVAEEPPHTICRLWCSVLAFWCTCLPHCSAHSPHRHIDSNQSNATYYPYFTLVPISFPLIGLTQLLTFWSYGPFPRYCLCCRHCSIRRCTTWGDASTFLIFHMSFQPSSSIFNHLWLMSLILSLWDSFLSSNAHDWLPLNASTLFPV